MPNSNAVEVTSGADLEIAFEGDVEHVRSFHVGDEFGLVVSDADPETALDVIAADPDAESAWVALREVLLELADADCNTSEMVDYLATAKCGIDPEEWAERSAAHEGTVKQNSRATSEHLRTHAEGLE